MQLSQSDTTRLSNVDTSRICRGPWRVPRTLLPRSCSLASTGIDTDHATLPQHFASTSALKLSEAEAWEERDGKHLTRFCNTVYYCALCVHYLPFQTEYILASRDNCQG